MPQLKKFDGYLVHPQRAHSVVTPAYDGMQPSERRAFAGRYPGNYVNVMRSLEEFDEDNKPTLPEILNHNQSHLAWMLENGDFVKTQCSAFYLYKLKHGVHEQVGLIADIPVQDYNNSRLKKHEDTQRQKEDMLTRYQEVVGVTSSPVCVAYPDRRKIDDAVNRAMSAVPYLSLTAWDDVEQTVWRIDDAEIEQELVDEFAQIEYTYLTDGHHRCASGARFSELVSSQAHNHGKFPNSDHLLVALFPQSQLKIYSYFRCIRDLNGMTVPELVWAIEQAGISVERQENDDLGALLPESNRQITMIVDDAVFSLKIPDELVPRDDPVGRLDVSILQNTILAPILGIHDARGDERLSYAPGVEGISGLIERCRQDWRLGFACVDTTIEEVIEVADARQTMPPKSTWFDPKLRAGIFLRKC